MNEELPSANEDLETLKEELQSLNEELSTVNSQLEEKVNDLDAAHSDLSSLMVAGGIAILFLDRDLRIKRFTAPASKLLNLLSDDVGRSVHDLAPLLTDGHLVPDARRVMETMISIESEVRSGAGHNYLRRILPYQGADGSVSGVVVVFFDVTERLHSEAQDSRLAAILRDSNDAIFVSGLAGQIMNWNRGAEIMYGYTEVEALKMNIRELATVANRAQALEFIERAAGGEALSAFDTQRKVRDGRVLDIWATVTLLKGASGQASAVAITERDVTERQRNRALNASLEQRVAKRTQELKESQERMRAILNATADAVVSIDLTGRIVTFNRAAEQLFDYAADQIIGQKVAALMPPKERAQHDGYLRQYQQTREPHIIGRPREVNACRRDGTEFPIRLSVAEVDHLGLYVGIMHDLTDARALQEEVVSIAMLEQQRVGQELHDGIQQELTGLGLLAQNLSDALRAKTPDTNSELSARLASGIAETNLHVRTLARGLVPVPIDGAALPAALGNLARTTAEDHNISCQFDYPAPVTVEDATTATHLYRIAQEAVSNAVRHAKAKTISIGLAHTNGNVTLEIRDDGAGIVRTKDRYAGIGLRLMEHRCSIIGGRFTVERRPEGGTLLTCVIPRTGALA